MFSVGAGLVGSPGGASKVGIIHKDHALILAQPVGGGEH